QIPFYRHVQYDDLCRFRSFVSSVSQVLSAWLLVTISVDRWIRTRFPFKSASLCTPRKALLVVSVLLIIDIGLYSPILTPLYGMFIPGLASVRIRKRTVIQPTQTLRENNKANQQRNIQLQMFILTLTSIGIFLITTLPISVYKITSPRDTQIIISLFEIITVWTGLGWFQSLNYAVNFYIHCLTSTLFRKEFKQQMKFICGCRQTRVNAIELNERAQRPQVKKQ
ncbi:unnamed protein product, partial [Adineta steineri]